MQQINVKNDPSSSFRRCSSNSRPLVYSYSHKTRALFLSVAHISISFSLSVFLSPFSYCLFLHLSLFLLNMLFAIFISCYPADLLSVYRFSFYLKFGGLRVLRNEAKMGFRSVSNRPQHTFANVG